MWENVFYGRRVRRHVLKTTELQFEINTPKGDRKKNVSKRMITLMPLNISKKSYEKRNCIPVDFEMPVIDI